MSQLSVSPNRASYHHASSPASTISDDDSNHSEPNDLRTSQKSRHHGFGGYPSFYSPPQSHNGSIGHSGHSQPQYVATNECRLIDYRGARIAAFLASNRQSEYLLCLPQAFELFLKHLVGGLHTVYTKLKRLDIVPIVCNVEQVRILRGLGAIQPGVNRCKLLSSQDFDVLYKDCTTARPGRPPKRSSGIPSPEPGNYGSSTPINTPQPGSNNNLLPLLGFPNPKKSRFTEDCDYTNENIDLQKQLNSANVNLSSSSSTANSAATAAAMLAANGYSAAFPFLQHLSAAANSMPNAQQQQQIVAAAAALGLPSLPNRFGSTSPPPGLHPQSHFPNSTTNASNATVPENSDFNPTAAYLWLLSQQQQHLPNAAAAAAALNLTSRNAAAAAAASNFLNSTNSGTNANNGVNNGGAHNNNNNNHCLASAHSQNNNPSVNSNNNNNTGITHSNSGHHNNNNTSVNIHKNHASSDINDHSKTSNNLSSNKSSDKNNSKCHSASIGATYDDHKISNGVNLHNGNSQVNSSSIASRKRNKNQVVEEDDTTDDDDDADSNNSSNHSENPVSSTGFNGSTGANNARNFLETMNSIRNSSAATASSVANQQSSQPEHCLETLLRNIEGLLAIAAHNARQQQTQLQLQKAELRAELANQLEREREMREHVEKQYHEEQKIRIIYQKRFKKERKLRRKLEHELQQQQSPQRAQQSQVSMALSSSSSVNKSHISCSSSNNNTTNNNNNSTNTGNNNNSLSANNPTSGGNPGTPNNLNNNNNCNNNRSPVSSLPPSPPLNGTSSDEAD